MERACSTNGEMRNAYKLVVGKSEWTRPLGRSMSRWKNYIKRDLKNRV
jgi:hypothetical protein